MKRRPSIPAAITVGLGLIGVLALTLGPAPPPARAADAAKGKPLAKLRKNQAWIAPDWDARGIKSIAIAPLLSLERNPEAEAITRRGLEAAFAGKPYRFRGSGTVHEAVHAAKADAAWTAATAASKGGAPLDSATARALHAALSADAVFFGSVTNWQRFIVDEQTRGASFTQVGVDFALYSLVDGAVVWRGTFVEKGDGPFNEPQRGDVTPRDPSGYSGRRAALEPPTYQEVVEKLMVRIAGALPKPAAATAPTPAPAPVKG